MTSFGSGYKMESKESSALRSINTESYDYRDQAKLLTKLTGDVSYLAQYTRQMQQGIDAANDNFIQQLQDFINEILILIGGGGDTGFDFGDLKYIFQAIGALFGFDTQTGIASIFPINLFSAAWHFISTYIFPVDNFGEFVDFLIDQFIATILDAFGDIPILGQALQQLVVWITQIRDLIAAFNEMFWSWTESLANFIVETVTWLWETFVDWTEPIATFISSTVSFLWGLFEFWTAPIVAWITDSLTFLGDLFAEWTEPIVTWVVTSLTWLNELFTGWTVAVVNAISESIDWLTSMFNGWTGDLVGWIIDALEQLWDTFVDWTEPIATWVISSLEWLYSLFEPWTAPFIAVIEDVVSAVQEIVDWVTGGIGAAINTLFPWAKTLPQMDPISNKIDDGNIPELDGSKITSGVLAAPQIPNLDADKITTGSMNDARIPSLDAGKITTGAFTAAFLQSNSVTSAKISDGAVSTSKIGDFAVNGAKIDTGAVSTAKLADLSVTGGKTSGLDGSKITGGTVGASYIAGLPTSKITSGTFDGTRIADGAVSTGKIADLAVTGGKTSGLDGSKITGGTVGVSYIPTSAIGSVINPSLSNGATISRRSTDNVSASTGRNFFPSNFFDNADITGDGITTTRSQGKFLVTIAGWYLVELSFRINPVYTFGLQCAPLLYKGNNSTQTEYKIGGDAIACVWLGGGNGQRYAQSTWMVPLNANEAVRAGYDSVGTYGDLFDADASGIETYFSIALVSKNF